MFLLKIKKGFKTEVEISKGHTSAQVKKKTQDSIRFSSRRPQLNFLSLSAGIVKTKKSKEQNKKWGQRKMEKYNNKKIPRTHTQRSY